MNAPSTPSQSYDLHFVLDDKRFLWRNPNLGVTITDAGRDSRLSWRTESGENSRLWTDIVSVTLNVASAGQSAINQCRIGFRDGRSILVTDGNASGLGDDSRTPTYRAFVRALHARLSAAPAGTISFNAGVSEGRHKVMQVMLVIAALFFVGTPLVLLLIVREWRVVGILAAGCCLVWPFWRVMEKNRPREYDPRRLPEELME